MKEEKRKARRKYRAEQRADLESGGVSMALEGSSDEESGDSEEEKIFTKNDEETLTGINAQIRKKYSE